MSKLSDIRKRYPDLVEGLTDDDIVMGTAKVYGIDTRDAAKVFGVDPDSRSWTEAALDTGIKGVNALMGGLGAVGAAFDPSSGEDLKTLQSFGSNALSLKSKIGQEELSQALSTSELGTQAGGVLQYLKSDPVGALTEGAATLVIPAAGAKAVKTYGAMLGAPKLQAKIVQNSALRAGPMRPEMLDDIAAKATQEFNNKLGLTGTAIAGGLLAGGDAAGGAYERVFAATGDHEKALDAARQAQFIPTIAGTLGGVVGVDKLIARRGGGKVSIPGTAAVEFGQEAFEESVTAFEKNRAVAPYVPGTDILAGVFGTGLLGGITGGALGGGGALVNNLLVPPEQAAFAGGIANKTVDDLDPESGSGNLGGLGGTEVKTIEQMAAEVSAIQKAEKDAQEQAKTQAKAQADAQNNATLAAANQQANAVQANTPPDPAAVAEATVQTAKQLFEQFGIRPVLDQESGAPTNKFVFGDKEFFTEGDATAFAQAMGEAGKDLSPLQQSLAGKLFAAGVVDVKATDTAKAVINRANKFMSDNQLSSATSLDEVVSRIDSIIENVGPKTDLNSNKVSPQAQMLRNMDKLREAISGEPSTRIGEIAEAQMMELQKKEDAKKAGKKPKTTTTGQAQNTTGAPNGQQQNTPGMGEVSGQRVGTDGNAGPTSVQPLGAGSVAQGPDGQQNDAGRVAGNEQRADGTNVTDAPSTGNSTPNASQEVNSGTQTSESTNGQSIQRSDTGTTQNTQGEARSGTTADTGGSTSSSGDGSKLSGMGGQKRVRRAAADPAAERAENERKSEEALAKITAQAEAAKGAFRKVLEYVFITTGGSKGRATAQQKVEFFDRYMAMPEEQREARLPEIAKKLGVALGTVKDWSATLQIDPRTGQMIFNAMYAKRLEAGYAAVAAQSGMSLTELQDALRANASVESMVDGFMQLDDTMGDDSLTSQVAEEFKDLEGADDINTAYLNEQLGDTDSGDTGGASIVDTPGQVSLSEQYNEGEGFAARYEKIDARIKKAQNSGDTKGLEKAQADLAVLLKEAKKENTARAKDSYSRKTDDEDAAAPEVSETKEAPKPKVTVKPKSRKLEKKQPDETPTETIKTSAEQYTDVVEGIPGAPAFNELTKAQQDKVTDLAQREQLNLAAINKIVGAGVQASKSTEPVEGAYKAEDLRAEVAEYIGLENGEKLVVYQSGDEVPADIARAGKNVRQSQGFVYRGKAYLIADNIELGRGKAVFLHEVGSHLGLQRMLDTEFDALVDQINSWANAADGSVESRVAMAAQKRVRDSGTSTAQIEAELVAYFIEEAVLAGVEPTQKDPVGKVLQKVLKAFKAALQTLGINPHFLSTQDIVDMAYGAAKIELSGVLDGGTQSDSAIQASMAPKVTAAQQRKIERNLLRVPAKARPFFNAFAKAGSRALNHLRFTGHLLQEAAKTMPSAQKYLDLVREQVAMRTTELHRVEKISTRFDGLDKPTKAAVNSLIHASTTSNKWAFAPSWLAGNKKVVVDPTLETQFDKLSPDAKQVVKDVFAHGYVSLARLKNAAREQVNTLYDEEITKAKKDNDTESVKELEAEKATQLGDFQKLFDTNADKPYTPLRRYGKHVVTFRSGTMQDAMDVVEAHREGEGISDEDLKNAREFIRTHEGDPKHYQVYFRESAIEAERLGETLTKEYGSKGQVQQFTRDEAAQQLYTSSDMHGLMYRLRKKADDLAENGNQNDAAARQLSRLMATLHVSLMAEGNARQSENRRAEGTVTGADQNMMRSFHQHGMATASLLASLHKSKDVQKALEGFEKEAKSRRNPDREKSESLYNEVAARHGMGLEGQDTPGTDRLLRYSSAFMLLSRPVYYLQNAMQPWMVTLPVLMGRYGPKASGELFTAYTDVGKALTADRLTADVIAKLPKDVQKLVSDLLDSGRLNISLNQDMGDRLKGTNPVDNVITKLQGVAERVEGINRVTTAVAAYRLAKKDNKGHDAAVKYAGDVIYDTHGDYSGFNAPRLMRTQVGRVATQFRKFQLIQIGLLAKLWRDSFSKNSTPDEKLIGRKALLYTLGTTFAMGGMTALPGFAAAAWVIAKVWGSADEPDDSEAQLARLRRKIGDPDLADLLLEGTAKGLFGFDGEPVFGGWGNMASLIPYTKVSDFDRTTYMNILLGLSGPAVGGLGPKIWTGMGKFAEGDVTGGLAQVLPTGIGNFVKALELADKGVTRPNGAQILSPDDVSNFTVIMQALGLRADELADTQFINRVTVSYDAYYRDESTKVKKQYTEAFKDGNSQAMKDARERWTELNDSRRRNGFPVQPLSGLLKSPITSKKYERKVNYQLNKTGRDLAGMR